MLPTTDSVKVKSSAEKELKLSKSMADAILAYQKTHPAQDTPLAYLDASIRYKLQGKETHDDLGVSRPYDKLITDADTNNLENYKKITANEKKELNIHKVYETDLANLKEALEKLENGNVTKDDYAQYKPYYNNEIMEYSKKLEDYFAKTNFSNLKDIEKKIASRETEAEYRELLIPIEEKLFSEKKNGYDGLREKVNLIFEKNEWKYDDDTIKKIKAAMNDLPEFKKAISEFEKFEAWLATPDGKKFDISPVELNKLKNSVISGFLFNMASQVQNDPTVLEKDKSKISQYLQRVASFFNSENTKNAIVENIKENTKSPWNMKQDYYNRNYNSYADAYGEMKKTHDSIINHKDYLSLDKSGQKAIMDDYFKKTEGVTTAYNSVAINNHQLLNTKPELADILAKINGLMNHYDKKGGDKAKEVVTKLNTLLVDLKDKPDLLNDKKAISTRLKTISSEYSEAKGRHTMVTKFFHFSTISKEIGKIQEDEKALSQPKRKI